MIGWIIGGCFRFEILNLFIASHWNLFVRAARKVMALRIGIWKGNAQGDDAKDWNFYGMNGTVSG